MPAATLAVDWSTQLTSPGPHRRRAGNDYGGATGTPGTLRSLKTMRRTSVDYKVAVLWPIGHRSNSGDATARRRTVAIGAMLIQDTNRSYAKLGSLVSSPGAGWSGRRGRRWSRTRDRRRPGFGIPSSLASTGSFPARFAWREEPGDHGGASTLPAEAWGCLQRRRWRSPVLGFRFLQENSGKEKN
jgi:hypothetical protein